MNRGGRTRTGDLVVPNHARYQLRHAPESRRTDGQTHGRTRATVPEATYFSGLAANAAATWRNASPRWLTAFFSSWVSSAKVFSSSSK